MNIGYWVYLKVAVCVIDTNKKGSLCFKALELGWLLSVECRRSKDLVCQQ